MPDAALGRPRLEGEDCAELTDLGPAPSAAHVAERLRGVVAVLGAVPRLPVVVAAAVVHAEIATVRPFVRGNPVVARALDRALTQAGGLDPTGVAVTEAGHGAQGSAPYLGALAAYGRGTPRASGCGSRTAARRSGPPPPRVRPWPTPCSPGGSASPGRTARGRAPFRLSAVPGRSRTGVEETPVPSRTTYRETTGTHARAVH